MRLVSIENLLSLWRTDDSGYTCAKGTHFPKLTGYNRYLPSILRRHPWFQGPAKRTVLMNMHRHLVTCPISDQNHQKAAGLFKFLMHLY